jgi:excisionase family DNA binding protein
MSRVATPGTGIRRRAPGEWLSIHEASELVGVSTATLRRWCDDGRVEAFTTPGGHRRFARTSMLRFLPPRPDLAAEPPDLHPSAERIARACRHHLGHSRAWSGWIATLPAVQRERLRSDSNSMVDTLVEHLAGGTGGDGSARLRPALSAAASCGHAAADSGLGLVETLELFLGLRTKLLEEFGALARRQALPAIETTRLLERAAAATDRLLSAAIDGHLAARA